MTLKDLLGGRGERNRRVGGASAPSSLYSTVYPEMVQFPVLEGGSQRRITEVRLRSWAMGRLGAAGTPSETDVTVRCYFCRIWPFAPCFLGNMTFPVSQIFPTAYSTKWHTFLQALERPARYTLGLEILPRAKDCTLEITLDLETMQEVMGGHRQLLVKIPSLPFAGL